MMNRIKKIVSALMAVAIASTFSAVALADKLTPEKQGNYKVFTVPATITQGDTEFTVGIGVYDNSGATMDITASGSAYANLFFTITDAALAEGIVVKEITSDIATVGEYAYFDPTGADPAFGTDVTFNKDNVALDQNTPILNVKFSIDADAAEGTYKMTTTGAYDQADMDDGAGNSTGVIPLGYDLDLVTVEATVVEEDKTTATVGGNGDVTFDYAEGESASAALAGKRVVLDSAKVPGNQITANTTVSVTYTPAEGEAQTKTFGETLFSYLGVEGFGFLETDSVVFGIVCDPEMTGTFTFALN